MSADDQKLPDFLYRKLRKELEALVLGVVEKPDHAKRRPKGVLRRDTETCPELNDYVRDRSGLDGDWKDDYTWNLVEDILRGIDDSAVESKRGLVAAKHLLALAEDYPDDLPIPGTNLVLSSVYGDVGKIKSRIFKERVAIRRAFVARMYGQKSYGVVEPGSSYSLEIAGDLLDAMDKHVRVTDLATLAMSFKERTESTQTPPAVAVNPSAGNPYNGRVDRPQALSNTERLFSEADRYCADIIMGHSDPVERGIEADVLKLLVEDDIGLVAAVVGDAGTGKSTLLAVLRKKLLALSDHSAVFLAAEWLSGKEAGLSIDRAVAAVDDALASGNAAKLVIDTVDLLLHDEESRRSLHSLLDEMEIRRVSVVIGTRPREFEYLRRPALQEFVLDPYNPEELKIAVPMLAKRYCRAAEQDITVAEILKASSRRLPVAEVCENPLLLRLLFELADGDAPELREVDVTSLYNDYWNRRVVRDARAHDIFEASNDKEEDLSGLVGLLGIALLSAGTVELAEEGICAILSEIRPRRTMRMDRSIEAQIEILVKRGVLLRRDKKIRFFHQTMFEYAAAKGLKANLPNDAIVRLAELAATDGSDFFLGAVLEQLLVCWRGNPLIPESMRNAVACLLSSDSPGMQEIAVVAWAHVPELIPDPSTVFRTLHPSVFPRAILTIPSVASVSFVVVSDQLDALLSVEDGSVYSLVTDVLTRLTPRDPEKVADFVSDRPALSRPPSYARGDQTNHALATLYFEIAKYDSKNVNSFLRLLKSRTLYGSAADPHLAQDVRRVGNELKFWTAPAAMRELSEWSVPESAQQLGIELGKLLAKWYLKCTDVLATPGDDEVLSLLFAVPDYQFGKQRILDDSKYYGVNREGEWSPPRQLLQQIRTALHVLAALPAGSAALEYGLERLVGLINLHDTTLPATKDEAGEDRPTASRFLMEEGIPELLRTGSSAAKRCQTLLAEAASARRNESEEVRGLHFESVLAISRQPATPLEIVRKILPSNIAEATWLSSPELVKTLPAAAAAGHISARRAVENIAKRPNMLSPESMTLLLEASRTQIHRDESLTPLIFQLAAVLRRDDAIYALSELDIAPTTRHSLQPMLLRLVLAMAESATGDGEDNAAIIDAILRGRYVSLSWHQLRGPLNHASGSNMISALLKELEHLPERSGPNDLEQQLSYLQRFIRLAPNGKAQVGATERGRMLSDEAQEACRRAYLHLLVWRGKPVPEAWPRILTLSSTTVGGKIPSASGWELSAVMTYLTRVFDAGNRRLAKDNLLEYFEGISNGVFGSAESTSFWERVTRSAISRALRVDTKPTIARFVSISERIDADLARVILQVIGDREYRLARPHFAEALHSEDTVPETRDEIRDLMRFHDREGGGKVYPELLELLA
ncbi:hypothetical protein [Arthrobacter sp. KNU40]|uniref:hypothetical protein n=1 Tax=Arthrobacter sp. KNU40 TaxID=3447965 RepID=UPI003F5F1FD8